MEETLTLDKPALSALGVSLRSFGSEADIEGMVVVANAELAAADVPSRESVEDYLAFARNPNAAFDAGRDVVIAEHDGQIIAFSEQNWVDTTDARYREYRLNGSILPEWQRKGIGTQMLALNEQRARALAATHQTDRARRYGSWANDRQAGRIALLKANGYEPVRWFFDMTRPLSEPIPDVPLPDGLEVRPVAPDQVRQVWHADVEAFQDHWGGFDGSDEQLARWVQRPSFDPSLWVIAWDGDEVAGGIVNGIETDENAALGVQRGWLHSVFTRRPWRKRGLANALIARSLKLIAERGMDQGILGVDADNPTGALGLYERNGFTVAERMTAYRKPMDLDGTPT